MRPLLGIAATLAMLAAHAGQTMAAGCDAPKPDLQIAKPSSSTSPAAAAFSGIWSGTLTITSHKRSGNNNALLCMQLHVSVKDNQNAAIALCRGSLTELGRLPGCYPFDAKIDGNRLSFGHWTFTQAGPGTLAAQTTSLGGDTPLLADFHREQ